MTLQHPFARRFGMIWAAASVFQIPVIMLTAPTGSLLTDVLKAIAFGFALALLGGIVLLLGRKREDGALIPALVLVALVSFALAYPAMKGGALNGHFRASPHPAADAARRAPPAG